MIYRVHYELRMIIRVIFLLAFIVVLAIFNLFGIMAAIAGVQLAVLVGSAMVADAIGRASRTDAIARAEAENRILRRLDTAVAALRDIRDGNQHAIDPNKVHAHDGHTLHGWGKA
jgi:hypothetical protein